MPSASAAELAVSPVRRREGIEALQEMNLLSPNSFTSLVRHMGRPNNTHISDTLLALRPENRPAYVQAELNSLFFDHP